MARSLVTQLSALGLVVTGSVLACAGATPVPPPAAPTKAPVAKPPVAVDHVAALPTMLMPGIGMAPSKPPPDVEEDDEPTGPPPPCTKDEDCWSKTCCPAKAPEECVHALKARRCAIVDVACAKTPVHYTCVCDTGSGFCKGRLAPI